MDLKLLVGGVALAGIGMGAYILLKPKTAKHPHCAQLPQPHHANTQPGAADCRCWRFHVRPGGDQMCGWFLGQHAVRVPG
ncbi:MAG: hypothetical protein KatS3mg075_423 [Meiothermus sp.]|nr:MAG: hypothetical protein KatS3mg075_423 [Meiothermus sp.]